MGFQQRMMNMMIGRKSPEDVAKMMGEMMPRMMDTCFSEMDRERRQFMLTHCRGMLDQMDEKYLGPSVT